MFGEYTETDRLPQLIMKYQPLVKRSQGQPPKGLLDSYWGRNRSGGLKPCKLDDDDYYDDDDDDDDDDEGENNILGFEILMKTIDPNATYPSHTHIHM